MESTQSESVHAAVTRNGIQPFPTVDLTFQFLLRGKHERFEFAKQADEALDHILRALFLTVGDHQGPVMDLVRLACALQERLDSPTAAQQIVAALRRSKEAMAIITRGRRHEVEALGVFSRFQGAQQPKVAPKIGQRAPRGSVKLSSFLDPTADPSVRSRRGSRTR